MDKNEVARKMSTQYLFGFSRGYIVGRKLKNLFKKYGTNSYRTLQEKELILQEKIIKLILKLNN